MKINTRPLEKKDLPTRVEWFNTTEVYTQMPLDIPFSLSETQEWYERIIHDESRADFCTINTEGQLVAMHGLTDIDMDNKRAELYIVVNPERTGEGIGSESVQWLCNRGFNQHELNKIFLYTVESNNGARRFYERLGFTQEARLRSHRYHMDKLIDRYIHSLLRSEWRETEWANVTDV